MAIRYQSAWEKQATQQRANIKKRVATKKIRNLSTVKKTIPVKKPTIVIKGKPTKLVNQPITGPVRYNLPEKYPGSEIANHLGISKEQFNKLNQNNKVVQIKPLSFYSKLDRRVFGGMLPGGVNLRQEISRQQAIENQKNRDIIRGLELRREELRTKELKKI